MNNARFSRIMRGLIPQSMRWIMLFIVAGFPMVVSGAENKSNASLNSHYLLTFDDLAQLEAKHSAYQQLEELVDLDYEKKTELNNALKKILKNITDDQNQYLEELVTEDPGENEAPKYRMTKNSLKKLSDQLGLNIFAEEQLKALKSLENIVFLEQSLFGTALVRLKLFMQDDYKMLLDLAHKQGPIPHNVLPYTQWESGDCGCADTIFREGDSPKFIIGMYPYWDNGEVQTLDFSIFTRINFFSHVLNAKHKLVPPPNWKNQKPYSLFVDRTHQYKVKLDMAITQDFPMTDATYFTQNLIDQIDAALKKNREDYPINRLKPFLSFGTSPTRSMADGVSLNFNLRTLTKPSAQKAFGAFVSQLKKQLIGTKTAKVTDRFYLNLMIPADALVNSQGFYTLENLIAIAPHINLFIVFIDPLVPTPKETLDSLVIMKRVRKLFDSPSDELEARKLIQKMVPMIFPDGYEIKEMNHILNYAEWNYAGVGLWPVPVSAEAGQAVKQIFSLEANYYAWVPQPVIDASVRICNFLCPHRWISRVILFFLFMLTILYIGLSFIFYRLRLLYKKKYVLVGILVTIVFLMLVFLCDPYWKQHRQLILFFFFLGGVLSFIGIRISKSQASTFP